MSSVYKLKKGFNINLAGSAKLNTSDVQQPERYAIKPTDFPGFERPKLLVEEGDSVKAGTPLLFDKIQPSVQFCSPVSGEVVHIKRGEKRKLLEIQVLADRTLEYEYFPKFSSSELTSLSREVIIDQLCIGGVWPHIIQRPFGIIANPEDKPKNIFVSAFDTHPLAPDYDYVFKGTENYMQAGVSILNRLADEKVNISINNSSEISPVFDHLKGAKIHKFQGPHPTGNVGIQIHHIDPIGKGDIVWTTTPFGLVQIGKLFLEGKYDASSLIAITGSEVKDPKYVKTLTGACIDKFVDGNINNDHVRFISGNPLTGESINRSGFLGFYHKQLSVLPEGDYHEFLGWLTPTAEKLSFQRAIGLLSFLNPKKEFALDTNARGEPRAFVQTGVFEKVIPMDIFPMHLIKAIMAEDYDEMEALGIYEVIEEDLALCEFVDVSKHDIQQIIRDGINLIRYS